ncbi:MAG: ribosomal protein S18-alanine N-acetyltransferase [Ruminococcus sp.]|uniref:ribosomal protein S18-alanine N-acetyltransferase n=2 Tax=unclassified Ruminococcus TaxID=2608920 RepID=UPI00292E6635|nr:ribosomal protein S18-alanine N-acetyltransferase [uncultured Ruminococcus sp.]MBQ1587197.1 ribosomal protein S18-alanine N-acetyltransferase [Ruminococcus sp.]MBQ1595236.1 ribosomal protein S18-alanine N-acetyltransferase [Ruminococcus sp.]MBQ1716621.1 ribosomal protein S18-alanine N-acetyltransferase [Ruminococcus sp.]MBQ1921453.1 ribosomal protein S18-alanine N-acetyltransferase [Ruminococcus sp.]MBQ2280232.1 ribosomal protein S18-alanine N-acetyltransferase [Ruminococcus sp.]
MRIEKMTAACIDAVAAIEAECFSHPWSKKSLEESLEKENSLFLVAVEDEKVIGYVGMEVIVDEGYIFNVAVSADYRRRGVGYALVRELVTYSMKNSLCFITLEVRESNSAAISLYSKFGFIKAGERKNYYSDPTEAAVLMTKYF